MSKGISQIDGKLIRIEKTQGASVDKEIEELTKELEIATATYNALGMQNTSGLSVYDSLQQSIAYRHADDKRYELERKLERAIVKWGKKQVDNEQSKD